MHSSSTTTYSPLACGTAAASGGLYTVLDCRAVEGPFAARALHEFVHHWVHAALEFSWLSVASGGGPDGGLGQANRADAAAAPSPGLPATRRGSRGHLSGGSVTGSGVIAAVVVVRQRSIEEVLPWRSHQRDALRQSLEKLQSTWLSRGDVDILGTSSELQFLDKDPLEFALQKAQSEILSAGSRIDQSFGDPVCADSGALDSWPRLDVWTSHPIATMRHLGGPAFGPSASCHQSLLVTVIALQDNQDSANRHSLLRRLLCTDGGAAKGNDAVGGCEDPAENCVIAVDSFDRQTESGIAAADHHIELHNDQVVSAGAKPIRCGFMEVVHVSATRLSISRYMRRNLCMSFVARMKLPNDGMLKKLDQHPQVLNVVAPELGELLVPVRCICPVLLPPTKHEAATSRLEKLEFEFRGTVRIESMSACHLYGFPLVACRTGDATKSGESLAARVRRRGSESDMDSFGFFLTELQRISCAAVFSARVCPLTLAVSTERRLFLAVPPFATTTIPPSQLVLQGIVFADLASASAPVGDHAMPAHSSQPTLSPLPLESSDTTRKLAFDDWPHQDVFNPLAHQSGDMSFFDSYGEHSNSRSGYPCDGAGDKGLPGRGRGRGRGGRGRPARGGFRDMIGRGITQAFAQTAATSNGVHGDLGSSAGDLATLLRQPASRSGLDDGNSPSTVQNLAQTTPWVAGTGRVSHEDMEPESSARDIASLLRLPALPPRKRQRGDITGEFSSRSAGAATSTLKAGPAAAAWLTGADAERIAAGSFEFNF
eukprot:TRINITY_DN55694_c0_g1_i1.p1 TRINITY_DN55694_c0_g1~~TRINITY_DN55694_c0_g1_i1.p1  ORF type:complete len:771 (-),score=98.30 TRINITY_DN55694_c0_g1_i1:88-2400(-)